MDLQKLAVIGAGVIAGNFVYDFTLARFIPNAEGFGMDDVARALTIAATIILIQKML